MDEEMGGGIRVWGLGRGCGGGGSKLRDMRRWGVGLGLDREFLGEILWELEGTKILREIFWL